MSVKHQDASAGIIRTISHDFKEPLRSVRWYLKKIKDSSDLDPDYFGAVDELDDVVTFTQNDFQIFYQDYRSSRIALPEFRSFIRSKLGNNMRYLESSWKRLYPLVRSVKFLDPRMMRYPDISITSLNETVKRILRRYDGLLRYLDVRNEPTRAALGLHLEASRVIADLKAIITTEEAECVVAGGLTSKFDQTLISLVFQNLIVNSIKYRAASRPPRILIRMATVASDAITQHLPPDVGHSDAMRGPTVGLVIYSDNGRGIPKEFVQSAFQPFIQVNPTDASGGSGMGLAIVKSAVESHGGTVWLRSRLGVGATFFMLFPLDEPSDTPVASAGDVEAWLDELGGLD